MRALLALIVVAVALPAAAKAEQASQPTSAAAGQIDAGRNHTCAVVSGGAVRCWGYGREGELGYGNTQTIGDNETPGSVGPVNLGTGRTAVAISAGDFHTCALLDDATVRCWGFGGNGRLGYGNLNNIGDNETPDSVGPVSLGGRAKAIAAGGSHTCALLENDTVRCWGYAFYGQLGYGILDDNDRPENVGDNEPPASFGPVDLGAERKAVAISAGDLHTCAVLDNGDLRCWGSGASGRLGYGNLTTIGDNETPAQAGPVNFGPMRTVKAISGGAAQTCALLDDSAVNDSRVRCWGFGGNGRLGYGNAKTIGDDEQLNSVGPVDLGTGRTAKAISVGDGHACALLDNDAVRCWGYNVDGRLGYANTATIGDDELPGSAGPVTLGAGRTASAITLGGRHSCARLDDESVRCWGYAANGRLGYCNPNNIGDNETPGAVGPVNLSGPSDCRAPVAPPRGGGGPTAPLPSPGAPPKPFDAEAAALQAQEARRRVLRSCLSKAKSHARRETRRARGLRGSRRARALRHARSHQSRSRRACLKRWGRTPGRVTGLKARALSSRAIALSFKAAGTHGARPPAARSYVVKQSRRPIRGARAFRRAKSLCRGVCRFRPTRVGATLNLKVTNLRRHGTYYYAIVARDNVSGRAGPRSRAVRARTR